MDSYQYLEEIEYEVEEDESPQLYRPPAPTGAGTACLLAGVAMAFSQLSAQETATATAAIAANAVGLGFLGSLFFDSQKGIRNLLRTDLLCLVGIYALTLAEFLFPQEDFEAMTTPEETRLALTIVLLGIAAMAIGRHFIQPQPMRSKWLSLDDISSTSLFKILLIAALLGYLNMLMSVQFNIVTMVNEMMRPRFSQPWVRGRLGGWSSLLTELALMIYIIPPLAGVVWNRRHLFSLFQLIIIFSILGLTLFYGFAEGTRNVFVAYLATFLMAYLITLPKNTIRNTIIPILITGFVITYSSYHMLEFRTMGLRNYVQNQVYASETTRDTLAVDYNLASIGWVASAMPQNYHFLGSELLVWSLVKPIPRAIWSGKPEGLSISVEEIAGAEGWTVAVTYLGEAYMMAGIPGVIGVSAFLGALAAWWNRMIMAEQSDYGLVVYALGFFAAGLTMRSMFWLTTAILPVIALIVFRKFGPFK